MSTTHQRMRHGCFGVALVVVPLLLGAAQPATPSFRHRARSTSYGLNQSAQSYQCAHGGDGNWQPLPPIAVTPTVFPHAEVSASLVDLILKTHRLALVSIPLRRLKQPPSQSDPL